MRKIGSVLCLLIAAAAIVFAFLAMGSKNSMFFGLAIFRTVRDGNFMSMIGNIFCILLTVVGFGATGYFGLTNKSDKKTLFWSAGMTAISIISLVISFFNGFTIGDIVLIIPSAMVLISMFTGKE